MKYDLRKPTVWAVKLGIRVGIFYACKQEKSQEKFERERDFDGKLQQLYKLHGA